MNIVQQKVGKYTYLYESISFRDENGKPRNKRKIVGKLDPVTGKPMYKPEYLEQRQAEGNPIVLPEEECSYSVSEIKQSSIQNYGTYLLMNTIGKQTGLAAVLKEVFPHHYAEIFTLATFLAVSGEPFSYCEDWLAENVSLPVGNLSSQSISELLYSIEPNDRLQFYRRWFAYRKEREYLALDITSLSSYSELVDMVEWGYNREGDKLPQLNMCLLMGQSSGLPVYQKIYNGSLKDVSTLQTTLAGLRDVTDDISPMVVMDKGFYSQANLNAMLDRPNGTKFVIAVPLRSSYVKKLVDRERKGIDSVQNTILCGADSLRGITRIHRWNAQHDVFAHIYFNARKAASIREDLFAHVAALKLQAENTPEKVKDHSEYSHYLNIRRSSYCDYTVSIKEDVVMEEIQYAGWLVILSNCVDNASEAISIYRTKDVVEKGFHRLKDSLDMRRMRAHNSRTIENKAFIGFLALILVSHIHKVMTDKNLYRRMTMKKLFLTLAKLKRQNFCHDTIVYPLTRELKDIFETFGVNADL